MFDLWNAIKKHRFEEEVKTIEEEINRSKRYNYTFGIFVVDMSERAPRGVSRLLPGRAISFHLIRKYIRGYDKLFGPYFRRYYIILPQSDRNGLNAVKQRIHWLAEENGWGELSIGEALYDEDGKSAQALLDKAISRLSG
ncbi:MAG: hypothetical protein GTO16_12155 [Candidatus Aminicenantes bacterium]|nr:hypothetical protein [Candidatus Aminicenantes bacterium]